MLGVIGHACLPTVLPTQVAEDVAGGRLSVPMATR